MAESMVERVARAVFAQMTEGVRWPEGAPAAAGWDYCSEEAKAKWQKMAHAAIAAMRSPEVIEDACRRAADPKTGYICWEGISVHRAADVMDAVLGAALAEPSALGE